MVLTARKIAVTVNSRQYQGISVPSNNKSRTVFVAQYGSDVFCSGITKKIRVRKNADFLCIIHYSLFIIHYSFASQADFNEE